MGQPNWQWPNPHRAANVGQKGDCTRIARIGWGHIVPVWHGLANATLYHTTWVSQLATQYCTHMAWVGQGCSVPVPHRSAGAVVHLYHTVWPRAMTHGSPYHIYHLPIWVIHLNTFDMELTIYVQDSFFNVNWMVMFVLWSDYLMWQLSWECWYRAYHIWLGLIFPCEFNGDVCFVIGLPDLAIILGMLI